MKPVMTRLALSLMLAGAALACGRTEPAPEQAEPPTLDVTHWTGTTELFMEYPPLVAGQTALFAVHLTRLSDFSAMTAGRPRIEMTPESGGQPVVLPLVLAEVGQKPFAARSSDGIVDHHVVGVDRVEHVLQCGINELVIPARAIGDRIGPGHWPTIRLVE